MAGVALGPAQPPWLPWPRLHREPEPPMPEPTGRGSREFLPAALRPGPVVVSSVGIDNAGERDTIDPPAGKTFKLERRDAATYLVLHKSPDLPVDLIG